MTLANYLTLLRVILSPLFLIIYLWHDSFNLNLASLPYALLLVVAVLEFSDFLDGYLARKYGEVTDLGKILDPMADSVSRFAVFLAFTQEPVSLPVIYVFALAWRDSIVSTLRTICALKGFALAARLSGKAKALIQAISAILIIFLLIPYGRGEISKETLQYASTWIAGIAVTYTLFSLFDYMIANKEYISKMLTIKGK
ncbi:CDP-diacylglycerol--glycerol-3-phosphate 3-phosphatidyltransferase [Criblamydia sequanensis]|uniref:CDP-diacylglycerol--glycerol-3-phosphate 3-phosphatidyltransferase n=1 Tax=Candidatus Criblamydia sequanensis CRIB-18 TaxID=1437425 RepID=A0A090D1X4_9BACT|nr:CDP-diacylglycerol--glycerol-3-phosphate 3-phosphatidyltransferase [Criblamydia sequanensis]CDR33853.1 CDP-diacylglycerol-glycerol-3-phosphate 3-phosphatidyltransferase [Criblamydia sequanensis CRIB-18]